MGFCWSPGEWRQQFIKPRKCVKMRRDHPICPDTLIIKNGIVLYLEREWRAMTESGWSLEG